jgi:large subunit ribosomal protein L19
MDQIRQLELENMKSDLPSFNAGDTVDVHYLIREGDKERIQIFSGTVIKIAGTGVRRTFLVRRLVSGQGVERTFPLHSPRVKDIQVTARGKARRARLYYLRDRVGKAVRLPANFGKNRGPSSRRGLSAGDVTAVPAPAPAPAQAEESTPAAEE